MINPCETIQNGALLPGLSECIYQPLETIDELKQKVCIKGSNVANYFFIGSNFIPQLKNIHLALSHKLTLTHRHEHIQSLTHPPNTHLYLCTHARSHTCTQAASGAAFLDFTFALRCMRSLNANPEVDIDTQTFQLEKIVVGCHHKYV